MISVFVLTLIFLNIKHNYPLICEQSMVKWTQEPPWTQLNQPR